MLRCTVSRPYTVYPLLCFTEVKIVDQLLINKELHLSTWEEYVVLLWSIET